MSQSSHIAILTGSHLCHNPRVIKEATALALAGYKVEVLGGWHDPVLKMRDQELMATIPFNFRPVGDLTEQVGWRFALRLRRRFASLLHARMGRENHWQLGYFVSALSQAARRSQASLMIAHSEPAMWAVMHAKNRSSMAGGIAPAARSSSVRLVGADLEDWFSEDLPPAARSHRPIKLLRHLERELAHGGAHLTCTSKAMSQALATAYECRPPTVIYNAFPWGDRQALDGKFKDRRDRSLPSVHWYSQTIGQDRGLGDLFAALPLMRHEFEIHLRGNLAPGFERWLNTSVPERWRQRVFMHPLVSNQELLSRIAEHDLGFAGEQKAVSPNRDLTVTNKILHYLLAGLAVVASDTAGQREIADQAGGAVRIYRSGDAGCLAHCLSDLLASPEKLQTAKRAALESAETCFCWERQVPVLLESIQKGLIMEDDGHPRAGILQGGPFSTMA